jgi:hypothetical protein
MLFRHHPKPFVNQQLCVQAVHLLPVALLLHLSVAVWMFGNDEILQSDSVDLSPILGGFGINVSDDGGGGSGGAASGVMERLARVDPLGRRGLFQRLLRQNTLKHGVLIAIVAAGLLASKAFGGVVGACLLDLQRYLLEKVRGPGTH